MGIARLVRALRRTALALLPRRFHSRRVAAELRVARLTAEQRRELARNLRDMLRPKAA